MRFGLLGTGPWAGMTQGPALHAHPEAELAGVWGRRPEAAAELAATFGARPYEDVDALLADCDAVAVALPPDVQAPLAVRAAEAGCHLLLDKPVATTTEAARRVADAADRAGVASVVFFTLRFDAVKAEWLERLVTTGGWVLGRADWLASVFADPVPGEEPGPASPFSDSPWRREKGALWDIGPHALSTLLPVLGDVTAVRAARGPGDLVHLALRHEGGASSSVSLGLTLPPAAAGVTVELRGTHGISALPEEGGTPPEAFGRAIDALLTAARTGTPHACDARFAAGVTDILVRAEADLVAG